MQMGMNTMVPIAVHHPWLDFRGFFMNGDKWTCFKTGDGKNDEFLQKLRVNYGCVCQKTNTRL